MTANQANFFLYSVSSEEGGKNIPKDWNNQSKFSLQLPQSS